MDDKRKKMIAPVIITLIWLGIFIPYLFLFAFLFFGTHDIPVVVTAAVLFMPVGIIYTCLCALRDRIKEIKSGEEDDLSQY